MDHLLLTPEPLAIDKIIASSSSPKAGGIAVFLGTTREENSADGKQLLALDYEAYAEMANRQLAELANRAREQWPIINLAIVHRLGRVGLGDPSVAIVVSTPHRAEAFEACRWIIDTLKKDVAIWKKEIWDDGTGSWSGIPPGG